MKNLFLFSLVLENKKMERGAGQTAAHPNFVRARSRVIKNRYSTVSTVSLVKYILA